MWVVVTQVETDRQTDRHRQTTCKRQLWIDSNQLLLAGRQVDFFSPLFLRERTSQALKKKKKKKKKKWSPVLNHIIIMHHVEALKGLLEERGFKFTSSPLVELEVTSHCLIFRCLRQKDQAPVRIKVLNLSFPLPRHLCNFQHEHKIVEQLKEVQGVVKIHERISVPNTEALVMEDFGGEPLDKWLQWDGPFADRLPQFIDLAIDVTKTLSEVHAHSIVHKDIKVCLFYYPSILFPSSSSSS